MSRLTLASLLFLVALPAHAHVGAGPTHSFMAGVMHPLGGLDHMAAMVSVGLWAALNGGRKIWVWPAVFVTTMLAAAAVGYAGIGLPFVEPTIAASVIALGLLSAIALKAPTSVGAAIVALFAIAHGHAHGTELGEATAATYAAGFALSTAALHGVGIWIATVGPRSAGIVPARAAGIVAALAGVALLVK